MATLNLEANEEITLSALFKREEIAVNEFQPYDFEITDILSGVVEFIKRQNNRDDSKKMAKVIEAFKITIEGKNHGIYLLKSDSGCDIIYNVCQNNINLIKT